MSNNQEGVQALLIEYLKQIEKTAARALEVGADAENFLELTLRLARDAIANAEGKQ